LLRDRPIVFRAALAGKGFSFKKSSMRTYCFFFLEDPLRSALESVAAEHELFDGRGPEGKPGFCGV